jgi:Ser-tRNA(Ala) deacylase AlaX
MPVSQPTLPLMQIEDFEIRRKYGAGDTSQQPYKGYIQFRYGPNSYDYARIDFSGELMRQVLEAAADVVGRNISSAFALLPVEKAEEPPTPAPRPQADIDLEEDEVPF